MLILKAVIRGDRLHLSEAAIGGLQTQNGLKSSKMVATRLETHKNTEDQSLPSAVSFLSSYLCASMQLWAFSVIMVLWDYFLNFSDCYNHKSNKQSLNCESTEAETPPLWWRGGSGGF